MNDIQVANNSIDIFETILGVAIVLLPVLLTVLLSTKLLKGSVKDLRELWHEITAKFVGSMDDPNDLLVRVIALVFKVDPIIVAKYSKRIAEAIKQVLDQVLKEEAAAKLPPKPAERM